MNTATVRVYAAGGGGIKMLSVYANTGSQPNFADLDIACLDTSDTNFKASPFQGQDKLFIIPEADGSGADRAKNYESIEDKYNEIINKFPPRDVNVFVCTGSGGSGSTYANVMAPKLAKAGHSVVVIMVGSKESRKRITNTRGTLNSLLNTVEITEAPIMLRYHCNDKSGKFGPVDDAVQADISYICYLASRQNTGLDGADVANFFNYRKVLPTLPPMLTMLTITDSVKELANVKSPIAIASVYKEADPTKHGVDSDYDCFGTNNCTQVKNDIHYAISNAGVKEILQDLEKSLEENVAKSNERSTVSLISDETKKSAKPNGIILD